MTSDTLLALILYFFAISIKPGPNNLMLLASGTNFCMKRTIPHAFGIGFGFVVMTILVGLGMGVIEQLLPGFSIALRILSLIYLVWLAWRLATSGSLSAVDGDAKPMGFIAASLFQWINRKAWAMALTAMAIYTSPENHMMSVFMVELIFEAVGLPCMFVWAGFGVALRGFLSVPARLRAFNIVMALILVGSTVPYALG